MKKDIAFNNFKLRVRLRVLNLFQSAHNFARTLKKVFQKSEMRYNIATKNDIKRVISMPHFLQKNKIISKFIGWHIDFNVLENAGQFIKGSPILLKHTYTISDRIAHFSSIYKLSCPFRGLPFYPNY